MKKTIICFGDSNTHGSCADPKDSADGGTRYNEDERWPRLLQKALGEGYLVVEEGLSGRTTVFNDPLNECMSGLDYIYACLMSHEPVDLLIIMLGTNDTKERFGANASCIAMGMERLVRKAQNTGCWRNSKPNILIVAPPVIGKEMESTPVGGTMGKGCHEKSLALPPLLEASAKLVNAHYLNAGKCEFNTVDYMHLTKKGHAELADMLTVKVLELTSGQ